MKPFAVLTFFLIFNASFSVAVAENIQIVDDEGRHLEFEQPLSRIISLSPHATELLFAAGATQQIIATVSYSDFPPAARSIPRIGNYQKVDLESIVALNPELIIGWQGGGSQAQHEAMQKLGFKIYFSEPDSFESVASNLQRMGKILGTPDIADKAAADFLQDLSRLRQRYQNRSPVQVFYQVWNQPLMTINKDHLITTVIELCGGINVFADMTSRAPQVSIEAVLEKDPQAIVIGMSDTRRDWLTQWQRWAALQAVKNQQLYPIEADLIVRQTPRILEGARQMCQHLEQTRQLSTEHE